MKKYLALTFFFASTLFSATVDNIQVTGDKEAVIEWGDSVKNVSYTLKENTLDVRLPKTHLSEKWQGKLKIENPHALVQSINCLSQEGDSLRCKVVLNGSMEKIKDRVETASTSLKIKYPNSESVTLDLLTEEQQPLAVKTVDTQKAKSGGSLFFQSLIIILFIMGLCAGGFFLLKWMKTQSTKTGTRKFLIESLSYTPIGNTKNGVCLLKVGSEFVLIGVTPQQVTMLSNLPKLQEQYESESRYERDVFHQAVEEELSKMKGSTEVAQ